MIAAATLQGRHEGTHNSYAQTCSSGLGKYPEEGYVQLEDLQGIYTWARSLRAVCIVYLWYTNVFRNHPLPCPRFFPLQKAEEKLLLNSGVLQPPFSSSQQSFVVFQFPLCQSLPESLHLWCLLKRWENIRNTSGKLWMVSCLGLHL